MRQICKIDIAAFLQGLAEQERSAATIDKYDRALERFWDWLPKSKTIEKTVVIQYKEILTEHYAPAGVNTTLAVLNGFFRFMGWYDCIVKPLQIQRKVFSSADKELNREEYQKLVQAAKEKEDTRMVLLLQLMASTGIRVSEIRYVTAEAVEKKSVCIHLKGKIRTILLPEKLCKKLSKYHKEKGILSGSIFVTRTGRPMDRKEIWAGMKRLCQRAGVSAQKVFPHNLRHLFARSFYAVQKDIAKLADLLGHSSIETTRIYLLSSGQEHRQILDRLCLIC